MGEEKSEGSSQPANEAGREKTKWIACNVRLGLKHSARQQMVLVSLLKLLIPWRLFTHGKHDQIILRTFIMKII